MGRVLVELIGEGEHHRHQGVLILRLGCKRIATDALGFARLVEQTVALGFRQRPRNGFLRQRLERELHNGLHGNLEFGIHNLQFSTIRRNRSRIPNPEFRNSKLRPSLS